MNKWYRPLGFLLLASVAADLCGCAQSSGWLAKRGSKKETEQRLADAGKKGSASKNSKELAEMKSDESKSALGKGKSKSKSTDSEQSKLAAAEKSDKAKKSKTRVDPSAPLSTKETLASSASTKAKSKLAEKATDDLDSFLSDLEASPKVAKKEVDKSTSSEFDAFEDSVEMAQKSVLQVKKEVQNGADAFDSDVAEWAKEDAKNLTDVTSAKASSVVDAFEKELSLPLASDAPVTAAAAESADEDVAELPSLGSLKKVAIQRIADHGLAAICPDASGPLAEILSQVDPSDPQSLKACLQKIGQLGADGIAAAPLLQKLLTHENSFVRAGAAQAMAKLKISTPESVKVVTESVESRDANLRSFGASVLGEMGSESTQVLTSLSEKLNHKDGQTRLRAAEVLIRHEEYAYPALQTILTSLSDQDANVRWLATYSLAELAPESPAAVQSLLKASQDPVSKVSVGAVYALGELGPYAKSATPELRSLLKTTTDDELKDAITCSLEQIEK